MAAPRTGPGSGSGVASSAKPPPSATSRAAPPRFRSTPSTTPGYLGLVASAPVIPPHFAHSVRATFPWAVAPAGIMPWGGLPFDEGGEGGGVDEDGFPLPMIALKDLVVYVDFSAGARGAAMRAIRDALQRRRDESFRDIVQAERDALSWFKDTWDYDVPGHYSQDQRSAFLQATYDRLIDIQNMIDQWHEIDDNEFDRWARLFEGYIRDKDPTPILIGMETTVSKLERLSKIAQYAASAAEAARYGR